jgi:hypothetical protein
MQAMQVCGTQTEIKCAVINLRTVRNVRTVETIETVEITDTTDPTDFVWLKLFEVLCAGGLVNMFICLVFVIKK